MTTVEKFAGQLGEYKKYENNNRESPMSYRNQYSPVSKQGTKFIPNPYLDNVIKARTPD